MKTLTQRYYENEELTKEERVIIHAGNIRINQAKCLICGETVQSKHRHDFVTCSCGGLSVDGGSWYAKRGAKDFDMVEERSIFYTDAPGQE